MYYNICFPSNKLKTGSDRLIMAEEEKSGKTKPKPPFEQNPKPEDLKLEHSIHPDRRPKLFNLREKESFA